MFERCLFCERPFPNLAFERFPCGRRIAYDPGRTRLWAICDRCHRWNLWPDDERREAIYAFERLARDDGYVVAKTANATPTTKARNLMPTDTATSLTLTRVIRADREAVFRAWTEPDQMRKWFCPEGGTVDAAESDLEVGGRYKVAMRMPTGVHVATGEYREIVPPSRLAFTWRWEGGEGVKEGETVVTRANFLIDSESNLRAALSGFNADKNASAGGATTASGEGSVIEIDVAGNRVTLDHDPIPSLKWPKMEMEFGVAAGALPKSVKPGDRVKFDMKAGKPGEYVITRIEPVAGAKPAAAAPRAPAKADAHKH